MPILETEKYQHSLHRKVGKTAFFLALAIVALCLCSCSPAGRPQSSLGHYLSVQVKDEFQPLRLNTVAFVELEDGSNNGISRDLLREISSEMLKAFDLKTSLEVFNLKHNTTFDSLSEKAARSSGTLRQRALEIARALDVQGLVYGYVNTHREGSGQSREGAAAGFSLFLLSTKDEAVHWSAVYERTNKPLSENLFRAKDFFEEGFSFKSPREMFAEGLRAAAGQLESLRVASSAVADISSAEK